VYALAVVASSVIAYRQPFLNLRDWDIRQRVSRGERPFDLDDRVFQEHVPIKEWIRKAFSYNPMERPSALELVEICEKTFS